MPPTGRIASLLGLLVLGAALTFVAVSCATRTYDPTHGPAHDPAHGRAHPLPPGHGAALPPGHGATPSAGHATAAPAASATMGAIASPGATADGSAAPSGRRGISAAGCEATVTLVESWPGGYRGTATIGNRTGRPMRDWYIQWIMPLGTTITQAWNGTHMQSGPVAMIHAPVEKPNLAAGATVSDIGFVGTATVPPTFTEITCG
ncbi:hypothetical protein FHS43_002371 [Streptosporangium becharense]|uniref:CBM2 domain-containing protein n=1 Tax=Streptosporangium becharense TaxID=1816182 RepID=A0A7W9IJN7_9ACTN|nr:cellulose binding domain-containing protein [Streptosporangium becharense]MBB2911106.1 hypothetical protein [Streptosporangium becharense]MBB5821836.1 hypothetical protein [Streptosporangium becharense]